MNIFGAHKGYAVDELSTFVIFCFVVKLLTYLLVDVCIPYLSDGKTVGRMVMKITMFEENGEKVTIQLLLKRASIFIGIAILSDLFFLEVVSFVIWGLVFAGSIYLIYNDVLRQTVHDKVARSVMLDDKKMLDSKNEGE